MAANAHHPRMQRGFLALAFAVSACGSAEAPRAPASPRASEAPTTVRPGTATGSPSAPLTVADRPRADLTAVRTLVASTPPGTEVAGDRGCTFAAERALVGAAGRPALVGLASGYAVAAFEARGDGGALTLARVDDTATPLASLASTVPESLAKRAVPALARSGDDAVVAVYLRAEGALALAEVPLRGGAPRVVELPGDDIDGRFAPALHVDGARRLVAYTRRGNPQRVEVAVVADGRVTSRYDVTPPSAGAASPTFVDAADRPLLTFVDPRAGLSLSHAVVFDASGVPSAPETLQPLVGLATPARLVGALTPAGLSLLYLGYGATNAEGVYHVLARSADAAPTREFEAGKPGHLAVSVMAAPYGVDVVALDRSDARPDGEVVAFVLDHDGATSPARLVRSDGAVSGPSVARDGGGHVLVAFASVEGVRAAPLTCRGR